MSQLTTDAKDKKKTLCGACESELEPDHPGIQCIQGHHFCTFCSKQIINLFFGDPQHYIPLRCIQCHVELNTNVFERQLTPQQLEFYHNHMLVLVLAKELIGPSERLDNCPFCTYAVIRSANASYIFHCERPECLAKSCLVCRKACPKTDSFANEVEEKEIFKHFICESLAYEKRIFDQALERGPKVPCPTCGLASMKDDSCTHMTCPTCFQVWCFFCGKRLEDCDRATGGTNGIIDHNHNWHINPNRCPMYLTQIQDVDKRWEDNEDQCLTRFHRIRSLGLLRDVLRELGEERINALNQHFNSLNSCGFSLNEILQEDLTVIRGRSKHQNRNINN